MKLTLTEAAKRANMIWLTQYGSGKFGPHDLVGVKALELRGIADPYFAGYAQAVAAISATGLGVGSIERAN